MKQKLITFFALGALIITAVLPICSYAVMEDLTEAEAASYYRQWMLLGTGIFLVFAIGFIVYWKYVEKHGGLKAEALGTKGKKGRGASYGPWTEEQTKKISQLEIIIIF